MRITDVQPFVAFQFTPLREGRLWIFRSALPITRKFQFTPLREGRRLAAKKEYLKEYISIHAPPRGATHQHGAHGQQQHISIHAPPRGATMPSSWFRLISLFQFTPLREGRLSRSSASGRCRIFQFTPLREGRLSSTETTMCRHRFQFTPLREGRLMRTTF